MSSKPLSLQTLMLAIGLATATPASAQIQTIERMKLTDGELSCAQLYAEAQHMDGMVKLMASMPAPAPVPVALPVTAAPAPAVTNVLAGNPWLNATPGFGGGVTMEQARMVMLAHSDPRVRLAAHDPGMVAQYHAAILKNPAAAQAIQRATALAGVGQIQAHAQTQISAAPMLVPPPVLAQPVAPASVQMAAQAQARKEHLTNLLLSKGCKTSDLQNK